MELQMLLFTKEMNVTIFIQNLKRVIETGNIEEEFRVFSKKEINDFNELLEFYNKYCQLQEKYENNKKFFQLLKAVNKDKKVRKLIKQESGQHNE